MPIRAYLDGHKFDGETIRLMGIAFEIALASLRRTIPDLDDPIRATLAQRIIALAKPVSTIPSFSVRAPCGRSVLLFHPDYPVVRRAAKPAKLERSRTSGLPRG
jgi:hypothetical protein